MRFFAVLFVGDHGFRLALFQPVAEFIAVIRFVAEKLFRGFDRLQQRFGCLDVRGIAWRE